MPPLLRLTVRIGPARMPFLFPVDASILNRMLIHFLELFYSLQRSTQRRSSGEQYPLGNENR